MKDEELLAATAAAHCKARNAPLARIGQRHTGERHITDHTDAYARLGTEWCRLAEEVDRRGLRQSELDEMETGEAA